MDTAIEALYLIIKQCLTCEVVQVICHSHFLKHLSNGMQEGIVSQIIVFLLWAQLQALSQSISKLICRGVFLERLRLLAWKIEEAPKGRFGVRLVNKFFLLSVPLLIVLDNELLHIILLHVLLALRTAKLYVKKEASLHLRFFLS